MEDKFYGNDSSEFYTTHDNVNDLQFKTCGPYLKHIYSKGIWFGDDPTHHVFPNIMLQIILMFFLSRIVYIVLRPLKQPKFICNALAGIILGPSVLSGDKAFLNRIFQPREMVVTNSMSMVGTTYFIFLAAVKMDKSRIIWTARKSIYVGLTCVVIPLIIVFLLFRTFCKSVSGIDESFQFSFSFSSSLSYFPVISHTMSELNLLTTELGRTAMSCTILHEIIGWIIMLVNLIFREPDPHLLVESMAGMLLFILFVIVVLRPMVQWIIRRTPEGKPVDGSYINVFLVAPLVIGVVSDILGGTVFPGAFLMGLIIPAGPPLGSAVVEKCELAMSELILPFLYIRIGQMVNVNLMAVDWKALAVVQFIMFAGFFGKIAGCLLAILCSHEGGGGDGVRNAFLLGLILNTKGIIELNLLLRWYQRQLLNEHAFVELVVYNIIATAIATPLLKNYHKPLARLEVSSAMQNGTRTLQAALLSAGEFRIMCCIHCEENVHGIISLLKACNSTGITPMCVYPIHIIDLVGRAVPLLQLYDSQIKRCKVSPTDRIISALTKSLNQGSSSQVAIQPFRLIAPYNTLHESICSLAHDNFVPLVLVPFPESQDIGARKTDLRSFNIQMQANAPCTVGILVDRRPLQIFSSTYFTYNIGVIFLSGPDDREALALVLRMSSHPGVSITVLRIDLIKDKTEDESETYLDDWLIKEFKAKNIGKPRVVCRELVAENTKQVMDSIHSFENNYDLVIVGKDRGPNSLWEQEMSLWVEKKELGSIGDLVASSDFCGGMVSVLVMHCVVRTPVNFKGCSITVSDDDETSQFSFSSSNVDVDDDKDDIVLLADQKEMQKKLYRM
ncbi:hypothetical protein JRO89_XS14G0097500 [Xanthoceras sorbifolium]|uniref:Cation/H+ exchanger domain-containing protein n=1 Tax=Xanthoceras sorbifolium TaxID=99658 RepID=A0ABQ8H4P6_9ROSI|nr:hypothetical protein JRO89_XS14G0097500 [Xanthoceras sorbifolium]